MTISDAYKARLLDEQKQLEEAKRGRITHGIDGHGIKHYICEWCELQFGTERPDFDYHNCGTNGVEHSSRRGKIINYDNGEPFIEIKLF